jgi:hypothetical protein
VHVWRAAGPVQARGDELEDRLGREVRHEVNPGIGESVGRRGYAEKDGAVEVVRQWRGMRG